jgi:hypothetical protein
VLTHGVHIAEVLLKRSILANGGSSGTRMYQIDCLTSGIVAERTG